MEHSKSDPRRITVLFLLFSLTVMMLLCCRNVSASSKNSKKKKLGSYSTVRLYDREKNVVKESNVKNGTKYTLPWLPEDPGYTFMGWDCKPGKAVNPKYEAGTKITVKRNLSLYAVSFPRVSEPGLSRWDIPVVDTEKYSELILVGDSRFYRAMCFFNLNFDPSYLSSINIGVLAKRGIGINYFKENHLDCSASALMEWVKQDNDEAGKPIAIVFNLGVNDTKKSYDDSAVQKKYVTFMSNLGKKLLNYNVRLFYLSVNPVNNGIHHSRSNQKVKALNKALKNQLKDFHYLDSYSYLMRTGYSTCNSYGISDESSELEDDGLHYTGKTYKRILDFIIRQVNGYY